MSTKSIEEDFAAVMAAYHALPPAAERKSEQPELRQSLMSSTTCRTYWSFTICSTGSYYCYWHNDDFQGCGSR